MRNFVLATALLLFTGIAFAQESTKNPTPTGIYYTINDLNGTAGVTDYTWTVNANDNRNSINATVIRYNRNGFSYTAYGASKENQDWVKTLSVVTATNEETRLNEVDMKQSSYLVKYSDVYNLDNDGNESFLKRIYYFSIPYEVKVLADIGVYTSEVYSTMNQADPDYFYRVSDEKHFLSFGQATVDENGNTIPLNPNRDPQIAFGEPLPAPATTLLITLCFGVAFVMYRNRKQAKA